MVIQIERERTVTGGPTMIKSQPMTESAVAGNGTASTVPASWEIVLNKRAGRMQVGNFIGKCYQSRGRPELQV